MLQSQWAQKNTQKAVLTFYRGYPYDGARKQLIPYDPIPTGDAYVQKDREIFQRIVEGFRAQVSDMSKTMLGMRTEPVEIRVARWGHPICLAGFGSFKRRYMSLFQDGVGRIQYCNQDNWCLPAIETCLQEALTVARRLTPKLHAEMSRP